MMGAISFDDQIASGKARLKGNREVYTQLKTMPVSFDLGFELLLGNGAKDLIPEMKTSQQEDPGSTVGGKFSPV